MSQTSAFRTRLAGADPAILRERGPAGDALRRSLLEGARIGVIDPGSVTKRFLYERARTYGVELVLVGHPSSWAGTLVEEGIAAEFVAADTSGEPDEGARNVLAALSAERERLDGVLTFWEDAVPATARVAEELRPAGLPAVGCRWRPQQAADARDEPSRRPSHAALHAARIPRRACRPLPKTSGFRR